MIRASLVRGFTLLEVIAAIALLAVAAAGIAQGQSGAVRNVVQSEKMSQAMSLAQSKMTEFEIEVRRKNFEAFADEEKGEFEDEKLKEFRWIRRLDLIDVGCFFPQARSEDSDSSSSGIPATILELFERSVRKVLVTVEWNDGTQTRQVQVAQIYVRFESLPQL